MSTLQKVQKVIRDIASGIVIDAVERAMQQPEVTRLIEEIEFTRTNAEDSKQLRDALHDAITTELMQEPDYDAVGELVRVLIPQAVPLARETCGTTAEAT